MAQVSLRKVVKRFDDTEAVRGIDLDIADKEFVVLVGPSGCGKSTTLRMIAGLEEISAGEIAVDGEVVNDVPPKDRDMAMVFQNYALYPHMSVYENMAFALKLRHIKKEEIQQRVKRAAATLGIEEYLQRKPRELSGGSGSASPWDARWCASHKSFCSTSRSRTWTPSCVCRRAPRSAGCTCKPAPPSSTSPMTRSRR